MLNAKDYHAAQKRCSVNKLDIHLFRDLINQQNLLEQQFFASLLGLALGFHDLITVSNTPE